MQKLARDIKERDFKNVYLLTGEEDYLRKQYRDRLAGAMADVHDTIIILKAKTPYRRNL